MIVETASLTVFIQNWTEISLPEEGYSIKKLIRFCSFCQNFDSAENAVDLDPSRYSISCFSNYWLEFSRQVLKQQISKCGWFWQKISAFLFSWNFDTRKTAEIGHNFDIQIHISLNTTCFTLPAKVSINSFCQSGTSANLIIFSRAWLKRSEASSDTNTEEFMRQFSSPLSAQNFLFKAQYFSTDLTKFCGFYRNLTLFYHILNFRCGPIILR